MKNYTSDSNNIDKNTIMGINRSVALEIIVEGTIIRHFKHFNLTQSTRTHHYFELILDYDVLQNLQDHHLQDAHKFLGKRLTVVFRYRECENEGPERTFVGVIAEVCFSQEYTSLGDIILNGFSPTILMDGAPHFQSFGGDRPVTTSYIAQSIIEQSLGTSKFDVSIHTASKSYIQYSAQYNETHYNYLARIAEAYGEQFYYDGEVLHFGQFANTEKPVRLVYGSNINEARVAVRTAYANTQYFAYNSSTHKRMTGSDMEIRHLGELSSLAYNINRGYI